MKKLIAISIPLLIDSKREGDFAVVFEKLGFVCSNCTCKSDHEQWDRNSD